MSFIFQCVYESETKEYIARFLAASLLVSLEGKARQGKARRELLEINNKKTEQVEKTTG
jgi:hypothetical protein